MDFFKKWTGKKMDIEDENNPPQQTQPQIQSQPQSQQQLQHLTNLQLQAEHMQTTQQNVNVVKVDKIEETTTSNPIKTTFSSTKPGDPPQHLVNLFKAYKSGSTEISFKKTDEAGFQTFSEEEGEEDEDIFKPCTKIVDTTIGSIKMEKNVETKNPETKKGGSRKKRK